MFTVEDGRLWRAMYEEGMTWEEIAWDVGVSINTVRKWGLKAGAVSRPNKRGPTRSRGKLTDGIRGTSQPAIVRVPSPGQRQGHRRRGRFK